MIPAVPLVSVLLFAADVAWSAPACPADAGEELERLVGIELRSAPSSVRVVLTLEACDAKRSDVVALVDYGPDEPPDRVALDLRTVEADARMRTAALAIGESVRARLKGPPPGPKVAVEAPAPPAEEAPLDVGVRGFGVGRRLASSEAWALGVALGGDVAPTPWLTATVDLGWQRAGRSVALGEIRLDVAHALLSLQYTYRSDALRVGLGPAADVGLAIATGSSSRTTVGTGSDRGLFVRAGVRAEVEYSFSTTLRALASVQADTSLRGFVAYVDESPTLGVSGLGATLGLGLGYAL